MHLAVVRRRAGNTAEGAGAERAAGIAVLRGVEGAAVQREVDDLLAADASAGRGVFGLQHRRSGGGFDGLGDIAHQEGEVDAGLLVDLHGKVAGARGAVVAGRRTPVARLLMVTDAFGMQAPLGSDTVPRTSVSMVCAERKQKATPRSIGSLFITPHLFQKWRNVAEFEG